MSIDLTVHLKKLSVGSASLDTLRAAQVISFQKNGELVHLTRNRPRREKELLDGGSIYWIIKGAIIARQLILGLRDHRRIDGTPVCGLVLDTNLVRVTATPVRIFQGWRYLEVVDAPSDLNAGQDSDMPEELISELRDLGIF